MQVRRLVPIAAAVAATALVTAACTSVVPGSGSAGSGAVPGPDAPPGLESFYAQELSWGPCGPFAATPDDAEAFADPALDCTAVTVPLDYAEPDGETARIAVLRQRATGDRIGSLLLNPGGPGASGTGFAAALGSGLAESPITQRFDLIGFDPRGIGASEPVIDCETDAEREEERADIDADASPEGVALLEEDSREFVDRCVERNGTDLLANVGTRDVVRDLDVMRAALGDEALTYAGFSYGTFIGAKYAEAFPDRVRALVLDGAVDPAQDPVEASVAQSAGFQLAFDAFAADCVRQPGCALGTDPAAASTVFQSLVRPLYDTPLPAGAGRELGYNDALTGTIQALYSEQLWEVLRVGLDELTQGSGELLMLLADSYEGRAEDGSYSNDLEAFPVISCVDDRRITDPAVYLEIDRRAREVAPFRDDGRGPSAARPPCAFWPVPPTTEPALPDVEGLDPVLVISVTGDPATPYEAGLRLAEQLGARLLTAEGNQHTVALSGVTCVDDLVAAYLIDLELPDDEARCTI
ncbi:MAG: alpha/beta hydrolase [Pseudonocardiales bacterium]|nr:alpha/beta hydrolase [Pseudonocardiales bacterium]